MSVITTAELGERLGVSKRRALDLLNSGLITGTRLPNGIWLADSTSVARYEATGLRPLGRPLNPATAWGVLWELSGMRPQWLSARTYARIRRRIRETEPAGIVAAVQNRTRAHHFQVANVEVAQEGLIRTGRMALDTVSTRLLADSQSVVGYPRSGSVQEHAQSHFMVEQPGGPHVLYDNTVPVPLEGDAMPSAVVAADLVRSTDTREQSAGLGLLGEMRQQWLAAN